MNRSLSKSPSPAAPSDSDKSLGRVATAWHTVNGLVTITDILSKIGFWLYRGTMRRTMGVAFALGTVLLVGRSDAVNVELTLRQALTGTGAILMISCLGGILLMAISGSFARQQLKLGEAKGSNLLEDMKKARAVTHCRELWERVFRYEHDLAAPEHIELERALIEANGTDLDLFCHPNTERPLSDERRRELRRVMKRIGLTPQGWDLAFDYAFQVPMARTVLKDRLRYDLSKLKDWYDGAPFHRSDTKLQEQFDAAENLQRAKREAGLTKFFLLTHTRKRMLQSLWLAMLTRAIQLRVARACQTLDAQYPHYHFAPDLFLWPSEETHEIVRQRCGAEAVEELTEYRRKIFYRVLSPEPELAHRLMQQAIYPNFEAASQLRRLYDPQYVLGELGETWQRDLRDYNRAFRPIERAEQKRRLFSRRTALQQGALRSFLATWDDQTALTDPFARRAVRIAMHTDHDGLRSRLLPKDGRPRLEEAARIVAGVVAEKDTFTRTLLAVRTHHQLTRLELQDYELYLDRILH